MKYLILLVILLPANLTAQKLVENKIDDFTKKSIKRTSWETVCKKGSFWTYARCSKIDSSRYMTFRIMSDKKIYVVDEGNELLLKMANDSIISLKSIKRAISCRGCGSIGLIGSAAEGIEVEFYIPESKFFYMLENKIAKMRLQGNGGYIEAEMKSSWADVLIKELELIK